MSFALVNHKLILFQIIKVKNIKGYISKGLIENYNYILKTLTTVQLSPVLTLYLVNPAF